MKKVLIISYFFPPCNFVGAERTAYWTKNLYKHNIYPIIITRCWNDGQKDIIGKVTNNYTKTIKNNQFEINYIKYQYQLRDLLVNKNILRKFLTLYHKIIFYLFPKTINYYNLYKKADEILKKETDINTLIISGRPFESFYFGYQLKKKYPKIKWIPDYRDQWNTFQGDSSNNPIIKLFDYVEKKLELKWSSNASFFISTTNEWRNRISKYIKVPGEVIINGYDGDIKNISNKTKNNSLKIIYAGTLYPNQPIEMFFQIVSKINSNHSNFIELQFIGCETFKGQKERLLNLKKHHQGKLEIIDRLSKDELNNYLLNADLFFLTSFDKVKGWYPVKLFEYAKYQVPIILYPSDNDIIESFIKDYGKRGSPASILNQLLKKGAPWSFDTDPRYPKAYNALRKSIMDGSTQLHAVNHKYPLRLDTDGSDDGWGAVLYQIIDGQKHVIRMWSKQWKGAFHKHPPYHKEAKAWMNGIQLAMPFAAASPFPIKCYTDHTPLTWLQHTSGKGPYG